ncbi:GNAT family N-acetyltransferase [Microbispora sp. H11081]|uniref:GNAT family N-acetyltransferase n=1 Tax=Microbispora sp. H11081 TaxID=2729107 RepID=UPI001475A34E|nr:peptidogalycan biosysnthesis protein [Microbispora sp. H11081]
MRNASTTVTPDAASGLRFLVSGGLPDDWDERAGTAPATLSKRWINLAEGRVPGGLRTFGLYDPDGTLTMGLCGGVQDAPTGHPRFDPYAVLSGASAGPGVEIATEGPHPWKGVDPEHVFPACVVMFPNYETVPAGRDARDRFTAEEFVGALTRWTREQGIRSVVHLYLRSDRPEYLAALQSHGACLVPMAERCDMRVTWTDFDGYLATLSRNRRTAARRETREIRERGIEIRERGVRDEEPDLVRLRCNLVAKYGGVADPEREAGSLRYLRDHFGDDLLVIEARKDGRTLAFSTFIRDGDAWTVLMNGADYDDPAASFVYFATMFYRPAELAPAVGVRTIGYGIGTIAAKRSRGCTTTTLYAAVQVNE